jgi:hypothetical protein
MAYTTGRIGTGGMFPRKYDVEPISRARVHSQDRMLVYLPAQAHPPLTLVLP